MTSFSLLPYICSEIFFHLLPSRFCKIHNDLVAKPSEGFSDTYSTDGKVTISDTALKVLMSTNIKNIQINTKRHVDVKYVFQWNASKIAWITINYQQ